MLNPRRLAGKPQLQLFDQAEFAAPAGSAAPSVAVTARPVDTHRLWLCIRFPELCLDALGSPQILPSAVLAEDKALNTVLACNASAMHTGVRPGMSLSTALALCPGIDIRQRQQHAEVMMLRARANWALAYTPVVSIDPAGALLLEVGGSLRLFGGLQALRERLSKELRCAGSRVVISSAPFAKAALWLARANQEQDHPESLTVIAALARLPLACLSWPLQAQQKLLRMGVRTLGDCMRLPRDGFARRIGLGYLREIDQASGRYPEILSQHKAPQEFTDSLEFDAETFAAEQIIGAVSKLFEGLADKLTQNQASAQSVSIQLQHLTREPTHLELTLRKPCTAVAHFLELLDLQLDSQLLPAPVTAVALRVELVPVFQPVTDSLLLGHDGKASDAHEARHSRAVRLVERLRARVGTHRVYGLNLVAEHRPEYAWGIAEPCDQPGQSIVPGTMISRKRPLWLLGSPRRLAIKCGRPVYRGELLFQSQAERIESGWWDGRDIRRDYYRVADRQGRHFWVYRNCRDSAWFLHGLFG